MTPAFLTDASFPHAGLSLSLLDSKPVLKGKCEDGYAAEGPADVGDPDGFAARLLIIPGDFGVILKPEAVGTIWARTLHAVEQAVGALAGGRWDDAVGSNGKLMAAGFGPSLDRAWMAERSACEPNAKVDMAYAKARSAGAQGGRPTKDGLILIAPPERHELIRKALAQ